MPPSTQITGQMTPAPVTPSAGPSSSAPPKNVESIPGHADLLKRQQELERKEAELERRERQMNVSYLLFINTVICPIGLHFYLDTKNKHKGKCTNNVMVGLWLSDSWHGGQDDTSR